MVETTAFCKGKVGNMNRALNMLHGKNRIMRATDQEGVLCIKFISGDTAKLLSQLSTEERIIYGIIEKNAERGAWQRDIRKQSNMAVPKVNKVLKTLVTKRVIKVVSTPSHLLCA